MLVLVQANGNVRKGVGHARSIDIPQMKVGGMERKDLGQIPSFLSS